MAGTLEPGVCGVGDFVARLALEMGEGARAWCPADGALEIAPDEILHLHAPSKGWRGEGTPLGAFLRAPRHSRVLTLHEWRLSHPLRRAQSLALASVAGRLAFVDPAEASAFPWGRQEILPVGPSLAASVRGEGTPKRLRCVFFGFLSKSKDLGDLTLWLDRARDRGWAPPVAFVGNEKGDDRVASLAARHPDLEIQERLPTSRIAESLRWGDVGILPFTDGTSPRRTSLLGLLASGIPVFSPPPYQPPFNEGDFPPWSRRGLEAVEASYPAWATRHLALGQVAGWASVVSRHRAFYGG